MHLVVKNSKNFSKEAHPMLRRLLLKGARTDIKDKEGRTPLQLLNALIKSPYVDKDLKRTVLPKIKSMLMRPNCCQRYFCMNWPLEKPSSSKCLSFMYILLTSFSYFVHLTYIISMFWQDLYPEFGQDYLLVSISALFALMQLLFFYVKFSNPGYIETDGEIPSLRHRS